MLQEVPVVPLTPCILKKADENFLYNSFVRQPIRETKTERNFPLRLRVSKKQALIEKLHT